MITRSKRVIIVLLLPLIALFILPFHPTTLGLLKQRLPWGEDACIGKPAVELQRMLAAKGVSLVPMDSTSYYLLTGKRLEPTQRAMSFLKGNEYSWFHLGTAINLGYVVIDKAEGEHVISIHHGRSVDSL